MSLTSRSYVRPCTGICWSGLDEGIALEAEKWHGVKEWWKKGRTYKRIFLCYARWYALCRAATLINNARGATEANEDKGIRGTCETKSDDSINETKPRSWERVPSLFRPRGFDVWRSYRGAKKEKKKDTVSPLVDTYHSVRFNGGFSSDGTNSASTNCKL